MEFKDRRHAGRLLADALSDYRSENPLVLAIPRGGVEVGIEVAEGLDCDFDLIVVRKLPFPDNPESGYGAIAEDGSTFVFDRFARGVPEKTRKRIEEEQQAEIRHRVQLLRKGRDLPEIKGRTVILIDDGIAMGSTCGPRSPCAETKTPAASLSPPRSPRSRRERNFNPSPMMW